MAPKLSTQIFCLFEREREREREGGTVHNNLQCLLASGKREKKRMRRKK